MTEKTSAVVKDDVKEVAQPKEHLVRHIVQNQNGQEALNILKGADKAKTDGSVPRVDLYDPAKDAKSGNDAKSGKTEGEKTKVEVRKNETLSQIVEAHLPKNVGESKSDYVKRLYKTVDEVAKEHGIANPNKIKEGQKLELNLPAKPQTEFKPDGRTETTPGNRLETKPETKPETRAGANSGDGQSSTPVQTGDGSKSDTTPVVPEKKPVDVEAMKKQADDLYAVTAGRWGRDGDKAKDILKNLNEDERNVLGDQYKQRHGTTIDEMLRDELKGKDLTEAQTHLHAKDKVVGADRGKAERAAEAIDNAANGGLTGIGADNKIIEEMLKGKSKEELTAIDDAYKARTGISLSDEMKDEFSGSELTKMLALVEGKNDDASRITAALEEHKEWGFGARSNGNIEKDLRDSISTVWRQYVLPGATV